MDKGRLEAFSDGVVAIIITITVLEIRTPHGTNIQDLRPVIPIFLSYALSFVYVGIYWNNHHHLMHAVKKVNGAVLWANLHLLFWLSLIPFVTGWMGQNTLAALPVALYGMTLLLAGNAYFILTRTLIAVPGQDTLLVASVGTDVKGKVSLLIYVVAIPMAFAKPWLACAGYVLVAIVWLIPDRRIERRLAE
jgi:uncharacterized membrane protein